ncbi:MAG: precorrin-6Y C5,15-methyltransferase (decarboxylating) subunit CbiT [Clostridiales bacterium]|nr:precorrin-6Y C5,15-methyltransferase (decarboxylating) subunit CbiT [Clostridiales bacterium]MCF8022743.1 precorrin-6Y C5,15-methyltransferase (decarboxylating) subunit CbiT [Clostridiales bacterium]
MNKNWPYTSPGIPDQLFKRADGIPMTKQDVRAVVLSRICPFPGAVIYDIGAGTGSVSVECALMGCQRVYAVEKKVEAIESLRENIDLFETPKVIIVPGSAPGALEDLPLADRIFIGGSGGAIKQVLEEVYNKLKPGGRLVASSITMDTGPEVIKFMEKHDFKDIDITSVNIAKANSRGRVYMWHSHNPVQVICAQRRETN